MPMLCAMSVLAALSALPLLVFLQPRLGFDAHTQQGEYQHRAGSCCHLGHVEGTMPSEPSTLAQAGGTALPPPDLTPGALGEVALCWNRAWHSEGCAGTAAPVGVHSG